MTSNMNFKIGNFKGTGRPNGVPVFLDKLPVTLGGVMGALAENAPAKFGRLVSVLPAEPNVFLMGTPVGSYPIGVLINDPAIAQNDPGMNDQYFEGRPATAITFGAFQNQDVDAGLSEGGIGMEVWANKTTGELGFSQTGSTAPSGTTYVKINASLLSKQGPNGDTIWLNYPAITPTTSEVKPVAGTPVASPVAGAVPVNTVMYLSCATEDALIYYTNDTTAPDNTDILYTPAGILITAGVTIKAIAYKNGYTASGVLTAVYTIA